MTHYSENPGMVRVDYFKPSGKWYMTEAIDMSGYWDAVSMHEGIRAALDESRPNSRKGWWSQFNVVVTEPYHIRAYPVMFTAEVEDE